MKQVHFRIEEELWEEFAKIFPFKGEPSAFFKRCVIAAVGFNKKKLNGNMVSSIIKEVDER
jgi:hypothetical protein